MTTYKSKITQQEGRFFAMVVMVDRDGQERVVNDYRARFFASMKAALKSTSAYIAKV